MKLEPPKMALRENGKRAQAAFRIQYTYFLNPKSGSSFGTPTLQPINPQGMTYSNSWNLTLTYSGTSGGEPYI